jgi:hypothetical protein
MPKNPTAGAMATPLQQCTIGGTMHWQQTRQTTAATTATTAQPSKAAVQSSQTNATTEKSACNQAGTDEVASKVQCSSKVAPTPSTLTRVAAQLEQIIQMHKMGAEAKQKIEEVISTVCQGRE